MMSEDEEYVTIFKGGKAEFMCRGKEECLKTRRKQRLITTGLHGPRREAIDNAVSRNA
jgi:hypothetical protein